MAKPNYRAWNLVENFDPTDAAYLWLDAEPEPGPDHPPYIQALAHRLRQRWAVLHPDPTKRLPPRVFRAGLRQFASEQGVRPYFLFIEDQAERREPAKPVANLDGLSPQQEPSCLKVLAAVLTKYYSATAIADLKTDRHPLKAELLQEVNGVLQSPMDPKTLNKILVKLPDL